MFFWPLLQISTDNSIMKQILLILSVTFIFIACQNGNSESTVGADTNVNSTTPPAKPDTNPIGIMMGDTSIGINDSLKKDSTGK